MRILESFSLPFLLDLRWKDNLSYSLFAFTFIKNKKSMDLNAKQLFF